MDNEQDYSINDLLNKLTQRKNEENRLIIDDVEFKINEDVINVTSKEGKLLTLNQQETQKLIDFLENFLMEKITLDMSFEETERILKKYFAKLREKSLRKGIPLTSIDENGVFLLHPNNNKQYIEKTKK